MVIALVLASASLAACGARAGAGRVPATTAPARNGAEPTSAGGAAGSGSDGAVGSGAVGSGSGSGAAGKAADPVRLTVPDIGVAAPVVPLDLDAAGRLLAPTGFSEVGWNHAGPEPGDDGVAVIAGHVDSKTGPAVFYRLNRLRPGGLVLVQRADGTTAKFVVDRAAEYSKANFPDQEVYHSGTGAQLRLITCGGVFDHTTGHYVDNVVVFAHLV
ncbi:peptidase C60 sortase A and B [Pseudofrankia inefficax]|uniref:Peptidase C60 sortase A and B n=2 Tax=Pseudofrankia inefficax (strain DSM 45817 / CECT 9037 / DDB 130130 / EuI1c) TaxID=298654 RepID=E3IYE8_PSEI1|nr:peptidase C60 sortase A and B [Pseudofrankia inefficax]